MANQLCTVGSQSVRLEKEVYINGNASVVGKKEGEGPLGSLFDMVGEDDMFGCNTWEEAESSLQKDAVYLALGKAKRKPEDMRYIFAGDLLGQSIATSFGIMNYNIPLLGVYGACSTCGESLTVGSMAVSGGFAKEVVCVTSSHFASAEKEFRFPLAYGSQRPLSASWTVTGSGAFVLGDEKGENCQAKITGMTVGKIVDFGLKDSLNMGACMAPAAAATIVAHFIDYNSQPKDYDKIITGDLGSVGQRVLLDLLRDKGFDIADRHMDCGMEIYDPKKQDTHAGGSGCGCCAVTLSAYILKQLAEKNWKKVLFVPTGALLSKISFNEGQTVPGIAHGVVLESL
ncbi:MAG: stage V sporulation protein AD [Lachnospiraceae bacterium]|nr:stage V sporulation protein AD [Lachnospiraceae bacterium]